MSAVSRGSYTATRRHTRKLQPGLEEVLQYVVRAACVTVKLHRRAQKRTSRPAAAIVQQQQHGSGHTHTHSRQNSFAVQPAPLSIADLLGLGSSSKEKKSSRFPKELIKLLENALERIAMRQDPAYDDMLVRSTFAVFYSYYKSEAFMRTVKDNRKVEDLILMFVSKATGELAKRVEGDTKALVNQHLAKFVQLLLHLLRSHNLSPRDSDLMENLRTYEQRLLQNNDAVLAPRTASSTPLPSAPTSPEPTTINVNDHASLKTIAAVFDIGSGALQAEVDIADAQCTDRRLVKDLRALVDLINAQAPPAYRAADFESDETYATWKQAELASLTQDITALSSLNPSLSAPSENDVESVAAQLGRMRSGSEATQPLSKRGSFASEMSTDPSLFFVPPDPLAYYRELVLVCVEHSLGGEELVDAAGQALMLECRKYWRITSSDHKAALLDVCRALFLDQRMTLHRLDDVLAEIKEDEAQISYTLWTRQSRDMQTRSLLQLNDALFKDLAEQLQGAYDREIDLSAAIVLQDHIHSDLLFQESAPETVEMLDEIENGLIKAATASYAAMRAKHIGPDLELSSVLAFVHELMDFVKKLKKRYKAQILDSIHVPGLYTVTTLPLALNELRDLLATCHRNAQAKGMDLEQEDMFDLYKLTVEADAIMARLDRLWDSPIDLDKFFRPSLVKWLSAAQLAISELVSRAIESDDFTVDPAFNADGEIRSHSIIMLFRSCNQHFTFLRDLAWPHAYWNARFMTELSKYFSDAVRTYCTQVEQLFERDMTARVETDESEATLQQRLYSRARDALSRKEPVEPFSIPAEACVKLNNIEWAKEQLDKLERSMDTEKLGKVIEGVEGVRPVWIPGERAIFTIKVARAVDVRAHHRDGTSDPYVVLTDHRGKRVGKTRTIRKTTNPRWNETFEVETTEPLWLIGTVWDRNLTGEHNMCGRCYFRLDPRGFDDFLPKDFGMPLDQQGVLHVRVSMEAELDDSGYYFGRAFQSLTRAENDMARTIVDRMTPLVRATLSHATLRSAFGGALDNTLETAYSFLNRAGLANARLPARARNTALTKQEIEAPVEPLLNYLDNNFRVLDGTLSRAAFVSVMEKLWAFVLVTIEDLIAPPLTSSSNADGGVGGGGGGGRGRVLSEQELDIVYKWLAYMKDTFHGDGGGLAEEQLGTPLYHEVLSIRFFYFDDEETLMRACDRATESNAAKIAEHKRAQTQRGLAHAGTAYRNLGTMRQRRAERLASRRELASSEDVILRVLQLRGSKGIARKFVQTRLHRQMQEQEKNMGPAFVTRQQTMALAGTR